MKKTIEDNRLFFYDHDRMYSSLVEEILPNFKVDYNFGYLGYKINNGKIKIKNISDKDDFRGSKAVIQFVFVPYIGIDMEISTPVKIYCRNVGAGSTMVDMISDKQNYMNSSFLNYFMNAFYKEIPLVSFIYRNIIPNIYFDSFLAIDSEMIKEKSFDKDLLSKGIEYLMSRLQQDIESKFPKK